MRASQLLIATLKQTPADAVKDICAKVDAYLADKAGK